MVSTLSTSANRSPAVTDADDAEHHERDDEAEVAPGARAQHGQRPGRTRRLGRRPPRPGRARRWRRPCRAARPRGCPRSCDSSFHDEVQDPGLVELCRPAASWTTAPSRTTSTRSARPSTSSTSLDTTHDGDAGVGQAPDQLVDLAAGADVDAAGGLVEQQHPAVAQQPPGEHDLLLVAARERAHRPGHAGGAYVERGRSAPRPRRRSAALSRKPPRAKRPSDEIVMLR